jgi:unsaturated pyranuronate lyase
MPFFDTRDIEAREVRPGWRGRFVHSAHMTFGYWEVTEGSWIEHEHPEEGLERRRRRVRDHHRRREHARPAWRRGRGSRQCAHSVTALCDGRAIVVDHPVRGEIGGVRTG